MRSRFFISAALIFAACSDASPTAVLSLTPDHGVAPVKVKLDAAGSTQDIVARFDFEGDGTFDTEYSSTLSVEHEYATPGQFHPRVEVKDPNGTLGQVAKDLLITMNQAPAPALTVTPSEGKAQLEVTADATMSADPDEGDTLEARFDFDNDGAFETDWDASRTATHIYLQAGSYVVVVEVRDQRGAVASLSSKAINVLPSADIDVDANRDGIVDEADEEGEDAFTRERGAIMLSNFDDDDGDHRRDADEGVVSGTEDKLDLAPIVLRQYPSLGSDDTVEVSVDTAAAYSVRVFLEDATGALNVLLAPGTGHAVIPPMELAGTDLRLFVEATKARSLEWDGVAAFTLKVSHADGSSEEDTAVLRVSPIIFPDNLQAGDTLYVMNITDVQLGENRAFHQSLVMHMPPEITIYDVDQYDYWADRWVQDNMQTGYQAMPIAGGVHYMKTYLETERQTGPEGLEYLLTKQLLAGDFGYAYPGGSETSLNYGGNLEVAPPVTAHGTEYSLGRLIVGGGNYGLLGGAPYEDHVTTAQRYFLDGQAQGPVVEVSTEWLGVGHIDEILQFVPDPSGSGPHPFKVAIASPVQARRALEELSDAQLGSTVVFAGRRSQTTVDAILADDARMTFNDAAQARIDTVRAKLIEDLELTDADFIEVPVLYEPIDFGDGNEFAVAYNPGIQNLVTARNTLFVPDPEGPDRDGADVWQTITRAGLEPLGLTLEFVDVFESYHEQLGEAHCGTEINHAPYEAAWWDVE